MDQNIQVWMILIYLILKEPIGYFVKVLYDKYLSYYYDHKIGVKKDQLEYERLRKIERFKRDEKALIDLWNNICQCVGAWGDLSEDCVGDGCKEKFNKKYENLILQSLNYKPFIPEELSDALIDLISIIESKRDSFDFKYTYKDEMDRIVSIYRALLNI